MFDIKTVICNSINTKHTAHNICQNIICTFIAYFLIKLAIFKKPDVSTKYYMKRIFVRDQKNNITSVLLLGKTTLVLFYWFKTSFFTSIF